MTDNVSLTLNDQRSERGYDSPGSILLAIAFAAGFQRGVGVEQPERIRSIHLTESKYGQSMSVIVFPSGGWVPQPDG